TVERGLDQDHVVLKMAELRFHGSKIVSVEAGLFKNVARDGFLARNLAFQDAHPALEFRAGHINGLVVHSAPFFVLLANPPGDYLHPREQTPYPDAKKGGRDPRRFSSHHRGADPGPDRTAHTGAAETAIPGWVFGKILLMIVLGKVEFGGSENL